MRDILFKKLMDSMIKYQGETFFDFHNLIVFSTMNPKLHNVCIEKKGISENEIINVREGKRGKGKLFISGRGIVDYLSKKRCVDRISVEMIISELKKLNLIEQSLCVARKFKEREFGDELCRFFSHFNKEVKKQVPCSKYFIDFVIDDIAIEFDENKHKTYSPQDEIEREKAISSSGYAIIRVCDNQTLAENLAVISKEVFKWLQTKYLQAESLWE